MNIYIKMQVEILKRADPDFNPMLTAKLGVFDNEYWIVSDCFAYCVPQKMFLLDSRGFRAISSDALYMLFGDIHGFDSKIKLDRTGISREIDGHNVVEFHCTRDEKIYFDEKLLKKFPPNCVVAVHESELTAKRRKGFMLDPVTGICYGVIGEFKIKDTK